MDHGLHVVTVGIDIKPPSGRNFRESTGQTDYAQALAVHAEKQRNAGDPRHAPEGKTRLGTAIRNYFDELRRRGRAAATLQIAETKAGHLARIWGVDLPIDKVTPTLVDAFISRREREGAKPITVSKELVAMRGVLLVAARRGRVPARRALGDARALRSAIQAASALAHVRGGDEAPRQPRGRARRARGFHARKRSTPLGVASRDARRSRRRDASCAREQDERERRHDRHHAARSAVPRLRLGARPTAEGPPLSTVVEDPPGPQGCVCPSWHPRVYPQRPPADVRDLAPPGRRGPMDDREIAPTRTPRWPSSSTRWALRSPSGRCFRLYPGCTPRVANTGINRPQPHTPKSRIRLKTGRPRQESDLRPSV